MAICSGAIKLHPVDLENSTAASKTRLLLMEKGKFVAGCSVPSSSAAAPSFQIARTASRARSTVIPDPRNPSRDRSSAIKPRSRCCGKTKSFPRALASRWENTTALIALSVNLSNTADIGCFHLRRELLLGFARRANKGLELGWREPGRKADRNAREVRYDDAMGWERRRLARQRGARRRTSIGRTVKMEEEQHASMAGTLRVRLGFALPSPSLFSACFIG